MNFQLRVKTSTPLFFLIVSYHMFSDFISFASVHLVTVSQQTANISRFCLVQKRLREKHGRMENLKVYNRIPDNSSIMADHMKTFDDYDIRGAPKTSEPVVCKMCGGWMQIYQKDSRLYY